MKNELKEIREKLDRIIESLEPQQYDPYYMKMDSHADYGTLHSFTISPDHFTGKFVMGNDGANGIANFLP